LCKVDELRASEKIPGVLDHPGLFVEASAKVLNADVRARLP
jgi:hypothetical protein